MYIYQQITESEFVAAFDRADRSENFSYTARQALYSYLDQLAADTGEPIELDIIALCCEWSELDEDEIDNYYDVPIGDDDLRTDVIEYLQDNTTVIELSNGKFLFQNF